MPSDSVRLSSRAKFTGIPNCVIEQYTRSVGLTGLGVYVVLKKFADYESGVCYPRIATIADMCGVSRYTVMRMLEKLVDAGLLLREGSGKFGGPNSYTFLLPDVAPVQHVCCKAATGGVAPVQHSNKEELDLLNETHITNKTPFPWEVQ